MGPLQEDIDVHDGDDDDEKGECVSLSWYDVVGAMFFWERSAAFAFAFAFTFPVDSGGRFSVAEWIW